MDYRFDEKGKYYTTHVSKRTASVLALAQGTLVSGTVHLMLDNRLKDEMNNGERFIAFTNAQVHELSSGKTLVEGETVILNKDQIVWLVPGREDHESNNVDDAVNP